mmetsp:Transcript_25731/g.59769  ORF Transcript_25731/g.59769 Transcript_25731/m.59769 type:complete len:314 (-) Transcript_25731:451-1392(-)|eukprot:CAMPEP_0116857214 /NCGR_PEP_ID=MMETSP0418-20121206/20408_1 /TAXON_ID=1158023 /ORGANISM="Astrosyne radiata, Strain 13vi08-1A" /LENGTH=313 /DNA_ID=CAMNT_0004490831 /DNA_START=96 /DNA_END=1037 /DNA_ORIENTATION=+
MSPPLSSTRRSKRRLPKDKGEKSNVEGTNTGKSRFHDNNKQQPSSSTSSTTASVARRPLVGASGRILSRTTWASLRLRRWQDGYWVHLFPASILLFHSFEEFDAWLHQSYGCPMFCLDFDTLGILEKQQQDDRADVVRPTLCHSKQSSKKLVARIQKLSMGPVHTKLYGNDLLHAFKVERWTDVGADVLAAFASADANEVACLRRAMTECLDLTRPATSRKNHHNKPMMDEECSDLCTAESTEIFSVQSKNSSSHTDPKHHHLLVPRRHSPDHLPAWQPPRARAPSRNYYDNTIARNAFNTSRKLQAPCPPTP